MEVCLLESRIDIWRPPEKDFSIYVDRDGQQAEILK